MTNSHAHIASAAALGAAMFSGLIAAPRVTAQAQASAPLGPVAYVASVKRFGGGRGGTIRMMPGTISVSGMPLRIVVRQAFAPLQESQLIGGPEWLDSERFDIEAKLEGPPNPGAMNAMLRQMLVDRFGLKFHEETRDLPVYVLVLARSDGRLGPALKPSAPECVAIVAARGRGGDGRGAPPPDGRGAPPPGFDARGRGPGPGPLAFDGPPPCGSRGGGFGRFRGGGIPIAQLATSLAPMAQRVVIDRTGLPGIYDVDLTYTPSQDQLPAGPPPPGVEPPAIDPNGPSLFTAIQEQLGLKLESERAPIQVVVIDAIARPTEN